MEECCAPRRSEILLDHVVKVVQSFEEPDSEGAEHQVSPEQVHQVEDALQQAKEAQYLPHDRNHFQQYTAPLPGIA